MTALVSEVDAWLTRAGAQLDHGDLNGALQTASDAVAQHPGSAELWNLKACVLVAAGQVGEGLAALTQAAALDPTSQEPLRNRLALLLTQQRWDEADEAARRLLDLAPNDPEAHRLLGTVAAGRRDFPAAERHLRTSVQLDSRHIQSWLDLVGVLGVSGVDRSLAAAVEALAANPEEPRLRAMQRELQQVAATEDASETDHPATALRRLERAMQRLTDGGLHGWPPGRSEGLELQAAHDAVLAALDAGLDQDALPWAATPVLMRLLAWEALDRLESARTRRAGDPRNLLMQMARAGASRTDRLELLKQHRLWGEKVEATAAQAPMALPPAARSRKPHWAKIRLGFQSSDLRAHVVGAFAWPLFEHIDLDRFEIYVYSLHRGPTDSVQDAIAEKVTAYRRPGMQDARGLAEVIAADRLDILVEIGGLTGANKPEVMAYRMAPIQVSWLGYPHSVGLSNIDNIVLDPYLVPQDLSLLLERPLLMPKSWISMGSHYFQEHPFPASTPPKERNGFVTFGTANSTYKYSRTCMDLWGEVLAAVPDSRFLFVRPESDARSFRERAVEAFGAHGVAPERLRFEAVRGGHLPLYDQIDISLDTSPLTGGTTTCESLWMGTPVVSLVGEALHERLSYSILSNAGLGDLAVDSREAYVAVAAALAADGARLARLRTDLRGQIRAGPLGDTAGFARDFYDLMARTVAERPV